MDGLEDAGADLLLLLLITIARVAAQEIVALQETGARSPLAAFVIYALAWIVGFLDSLQEGKYGWSVALVLLLPVLIGPVLYSVFGPRNTR